MALGLFQGERGLGPRPGLMVEAAARGHLGTQLRKSYLQDPLLRRGALLENSLRDTVPLQSSGQAPPSLSLERMRLEQPEKLLHSPLDTVGNHALYWPGLSEPCKITQESVEYSLGTCPQGEEGRPSLTQDPLPDLPSLKDKEGLV